MLIAVSSAAADTWEILTDPQALRALEPEWNDLWLRARDEYVTQSFAWCWAAWCTVGEPLGRRLHCVVARHAGELVLVWPFTVRRVGAWTRARPLGPEVAEYSTVLVERDARAADRLGAAWKLLCRTIRSDMILFPYVPAGSLLHGLLTGLRRLMIIEETPISGLGCDAAGRAVFERVRGSKPLRRRRRQLAERGTLVHERVADPQRRAQLIEWLLPRKEEWIVRTGGEPIWRSLDLYRRFLVAAAADERLAVFALTLDGAVIAAFVARVDNVRVEQFVSVHDDEYRAYSPGQLLRIDTVEWAFERGLAFDLRVGEHEYKKEWTSRRGLAVSYNISNSPFGTLAIAVRAAQRRLASAFRARYPGRLKQGRTPVAD